MFPHVHSCLLCTNSVLFGCTGAVQKMLILLIFAPLQEFSFFDKILPQILSLHRCTVRSYKLYYYYSSDFVGFAFGFRVYFAGIGVFLRIFRIISKSSKVQKFPQISEYFSDIMVFLRFWWILPTVEESLIYLWNFEELEEGFPKVPGYFQSNIRLVSCVTISVSHRPLSQLQIPTSKTKIELSFLLRCFIPKHFWKNSFSSDDFNFSFFIFAEILLKNSLKSQHSRQKLRLKKYLISSTLVYFLEIFSIFLFIIFHTFFDRTLNSEF